MRLFVAIELDKEIRTLLASAQKTFARACPGVRWVKPELQHITVKFLGEVSDNGVPQVTQAVAAAASQSAPFDVAIDGCGCFPPRGPVRTVWADARDTSGALTQCVQRVEDELEKVGFPCDTKPFRGHITLGRVKFDQSGGSIRSAVEAHSLPVTTQHVASLTLMSSVLSSGGPTYSPVGRFSLV